MPAEHRVDGVCEIRYYSSCMQHESTQIKLLQAVAASLFSAAPDLAIAIIALSSTI